LLFVVAFAGVAACACAGTASAAVQTWTGTYTLPAKAQPVEISLEIRGERGTVWMGYGHPAQTDVSVGRRGLNIRFALPGLPRNVVFDGTSHGATLSGRVEQGSLRGTFRLRRGSSKVLPLFGLYRSDSGAAVAVVRATGFRPWLVELPSGRVHGIGAALTIGSRLGDTSGAGAITRMANGISWQGVHYPRVPLRQREVRVGVNAATLTLPPGAGPFPAVAMVHSSGPNTREEFQAFAAYAALLGFAVLADDKRGIGQSTGRYPGEAADNETIDVLARDAQAQVRFLRGLPQVDPKRVGLLGDSQAGWINALASAREPGVRFAVSLVGPTVSAGETDEWGALAGKSDAPPSSTRAAMLAQVRAHGPTGFDARPFLARADIPMFWIFGDDDRNVPTELCVEALQRLAAGHDFTWRVLPMTHALLELPTGLYSSLAQSRGFAPDLYPTIGAWLREHV
jgi:dienelactone hydrolase